MRELLWTAGRRKATGALRRSVLRPKASTSLAPFLRGEGWAEGCLRKFECPTGKSLLIFRSRVKPVLQKYFCFLPTQISSLIRVSGLDKRGVAQRHQRGAGCGGRGSARDERGLLAYGEVVWFRRPNRWRQACEKEAQATVSK